MIMWRFNKSTFRSQKINLYIENGNLNNMYLVYHFLCPVFLQSSHGFKMFIRTLLVIFLSFIKFAAVVVFSRSVVNARKPADSVHTVFNIASSNVVHGPYHLGSSRIRKCGHLLTLCLTSCLFYCLVVSSIICIVVLTNEALMRRNDDWCVHIKNTSYTLIRKPNITDSEDTALTSYNSSFEQKDKNLRSILNSFTHIERSKCLVFQSSLDKYFNERLGGNVKTSELMKYEWARYTTFNTFPMESPMMPLRLAANGFYYNGTSDRVTCFSCGFQYSGWQEGDCPADMHARLSPECGFLRGTDHLNIGIHTDDVEGAMGCGSSYGKVGIYSDEVETYTQKQCRQSTCSESTQPRSLHHRYPDYERYEYRMETYTGWLCPDIISPKELAEAGYFYAGFSDCVRCFSCGGGLRNWEYGDGPWEEHVRWFPWCKFLVELKGPDFIREHQEIQIDSDDDTIGIVSGTEALQSVKETKPIQNQKTRTFNESTPSTGTRAACSEIEEKRCEMGCSKPDVQANLNSLKTIGPKMLQEENTKLKHQLSCKICMDNDSNVIFIPCGHMISCETCAPNIRKCAICREQVKHRVKVFQS